MIIQCDYRDNIVFEKFRLQNVTLKRKAGVFKFLRFEDVRTNLYRSQGPTLRDVRAKIFQH